MGVKKLYFETLGNENKQHLNVWYAGIFASAYFEYQGWLIYMLLSPNSNSWITTFTSHKTK